MKSDINISVIIVNYNGGDLVQEAVNHLKQQTLPAHEVIVIDNASEDGSADRLVLDGLAATRLERLPENVGFARANNLAAEMATGTWIALLNPDTRPQETWLEELALATKRYPDVGMFASAQLDAAQPELLDGAGDNYFILGIPWRGGFGRSADELPEEGNCFSPCGAAALFRRELFLESGGFDESYFCYCEDVDLGFRLRLAGEACKFVPTAVVLHHGSAISGRYSDFTVRLGTRNRLRAYLTNMPPLALLLTLPGHILATLYLYLRTLGKPHSKSLRQGLTEALGMLPEILRRRQAVQSARQVSSFEVCRAMSWNPIKLHTRAVHVWGDRPGATAHTTSDDQ